MVLNKFSVHRELCMYAWYRDLLNHVAVNYDRPNSSYLHLLRRLGTLTVADVLNITFVEYTEHHGPCVVFWTLNRVGIHRYVIRPNFVEHGRMLIHSTRHTNRLCSVIHTINDWAYKTYHRNKLLAAAEFLADPYNENSKYLTYAQHCPEQMGIRIVILDENTNTAYKWTQLSWLRSSGVLPSKRITLPPKPPVKEKSPRRRKKGKRYRKRSDSDRSSPPDPPTQDLPI